WQKGAISSILRSNTSRRTQDSDCICRVCGAPADREFSRLFLLEAGRACPPSETFIPRTQHVLVFPNRKCVPSFSTERSLTHRFRVGQGGSKDAWFSVQASTTRWSWSCSPLRA